MKKYRYSSAVITAGILWGTLCIFVKALSGAGFDSMQITLLRMTVAFPAFLLYALIRQKSLKIHIKDMWMFFCIGIVSIVAFSFFYSYTMIHSEASVAVVLLYTSPAFILILSKFLFKEHITLRKVTALVLTLAGCVFVSGIFGTAQSFGALVIFTGICSGFTYSLYTIFNRYALVKYSTETTMVYSYAFALFGSLFLGKPAETYSAVISDPEMILYAFGIGMICTAMPSFMYAWGLHGIESGKAAVLSTVEPLVGAMIGMTFYGESRDPFKICGIFFIVASIIILEFTRLKLPKKIRSHIKVL